MTTSKQLVKATPNLESNSIENYYGLTTEMIQGLITMAIEQNKMNELLDIQKFENGGEKRKYYLIKRPSKKMGYIYQMKIKDPETNVILPTKYSTGKNNLKEAIQWAEQNYKTCLASYNGKAELTLLDTYYSDTSIYFKYEKYEGRNLSPDTLRDRKNFMTRYITPFLQRQKVRFLSQITPLIIRELKNYLRNDNNLTSQTINRNLRSFKKALIVFKDVGKVSTDFSNVDFNVKNSKKAVKARGVFPIESLKGVFKKQWKNQLSKLLCMMIYFTGMRNSEIVSVKFKDIEKINDVYFLNVKGTKSKNAIRKVPIHNALYKALNTYVKANNIKSDTEIFKGVYYEIFSKASTDMGSLLGYTRKQLMEKSICYYSGRHSFKRVLKVGNGESIGNVSVHIQEMFIGHNHSKKEFKQEGINEYEYGNINADVIGEKLLVEKAKEVFKIIDHYYL